MKPLRVALSCLALLSACAGGPRPLPASATPTERLGQSEAVLLELKGASVAFAVESQGQHPASFNGKLDLAGGNALQLTAQGTFEGKATNLELDSRSGDLLRTVTSGPSASSQKEPVGDKLGEAVLLRLSRLGLLHDLATLAKDQSPEYASGGVRQAVVALEPSDTGTAAMEGEPCHRVSFGLKVNEKPVGSATVCLSDKTSLPLERTTTVHFDGGDMQATERYHWTVK